MVSKLTLPATENEVQSKLNELVDNKQDTLVSGTNIKTINNESLLGSGNINISGGGSPVWGNITGTLSDQTDLQNALNGKQDTIDANNKLDYSYLSNTPTIPTVNNATLTIQMNGTTVNTFTANASSNVTANITVPTKTSDLTNDDGFITGITSSDVTTALGYTPYNSANPSGYQANVIETVKVNGTALTPLSKAIDISVPTETTISGWGFTKNTGTVTSVNNVSPVNGNVSLTIPTVNNATLTITQGGITKGTFTANASSNVTVALDSGGTVDIDNSSITENSSDQLQTVGVIDSRSGNSIKTWTGTKAQYDAITTKDSNTLYNITDDTDVSLTILEVLYPVGSVYITTANTCPLSTLIAGSTWVLVSSGIVKAGDIPCKGNGMTLGLTDGTNNYGLATDTSNPLPFIPKSGSYGTNVGSSPSGSGISGKAIGITTDPTNSGIIADTSSLTLAVNIFERTA